MAYLIASSWIDTTGPISRSADCNARKSNDSASTSFCAAFPTSDTFSQFSVLSIHAIELIRSIGKLENAAVFCSEIIICHFQ